MNNKNNMPPGVSASDIPGNTATDDEWEKLIDFLAETGLEPGEITALVSGAQPLAQHLHEHCKWVGSFGWMEEATRLMRVLAIAWASSQVETSDA